MARFADAVVVGSALVSRIEANIGKPTTAIDQIGLGARRDAHRDGRRLSRAICQNFARQETGTRMSWFEN